MTRHEIQNRLNQSYEREQWLELLRAVLAGTHIFAAPQNIEIDHKIAKRVTHLGHVRLSSDRVLAILEIEVGQSINLVRNRVGLRNFVAGFIDQERAHGVLAAFLSSGEDYRFTFAARESAFDESGEIAQRETAPRRYTYVLGPNEACRTAAERFVQLATKGPAAALKDIIDAFSVEKLNNEFFGKYKEHYRRFCEHLTASDAPIRAFGIQLRGLDEKARERALKPVRDFIKKLLGRVVFLYFLQKKGWLGCPANAKNWKNGDPNFLRQLFDSASEADQRCFHSRRLVPLFFDTLNRERQGDIFAITGTRVPYLNGGLFERDFDGVNKVDFPPDFFDSLLEFFGQYNFTIDENDPEDHEIGIDPEMLGHIFENLLEDNKDKGAYYTPKPVVQYMCQQSLIHTLAGHFPNDANARSEIETLIRLKEPVDPKKNTWLARNATALERVIDDLNICDPAIGSGAFPIGLLQEIFWTKLTLHAGANRADLKRSIIQHSIHGVDMDAGAVEIARLRFWLALVVDEDEPVPLPNLDYQIMQGNSLVESFEGLGLSRIAESTSVGITLLGSDQNEFGFSSRQIEIGDKSEARENLATLQEKYFLLHDPEAKVQLRHRIDHGVLRAIDDELERRREELAASIDNWKRELARKRRIKKAYEPSPTDLRKRAAMQAELDELSQKKTKLHNLLEDPRKERPFFLWHLWFRHILTNGGGGFDIVIGNPPYVRADNPEILPQRKAIEAELTNGEPTYKTLWEKWDLYVAFIERGFQLLRPGGIETLIVSDAYCHSKYAIKSQNWFLKNAIVHRLDFLGKLQIFDAGVKNMIFFYGRGDGATNIPERRLHTARFGNIQSLPSEPQSEATHRLFFPEGKANRTSKIEVQTEPIERICYISVGMVAHADEKVAKGAFELRDLVSAVRTKKHIKPFVEGKHLDRWSATAHNWFEWGTERSPEMLRRPTFPELYEAREKLISVDMAAGIDHLTVAYDEAHLYHNHSAWSFVPWHYLKDVRNRSLKKSARYPDEARPGDGLPDRRELEAVSRQFDAKYLVAVMNSKIARGFLMENRRSNIHLFPDDWKPLPIPVATAEQQAPIIALVTLVISILRFFGGHPQSRTARDETLLEFIEALIDTLVAQLYYPNQFQAKGIDAAKLVLQSRLPMPEKISDEEQINVVRKALEEAYDIEHPLRAAIYDFGSLQLSGELAAEL